MEEVGLPIDPESAADLDRGSSPEKHPVEPNGLRREGDGR